MHTRTRRESLADCEDVYKYFDTFILDLASNKLYSSLIFKYPFWIALIISSVYVGTGILVIKLDFLDGILFWIFAPIWAPLVGFFGINDTPTIITEALAYCFLIVVFTAFLRLTIVAIRNRTPKT